ncbi:hypothetical protein V1477_007556, partial [Vespula maculifrons]
MLRAFLHRPSLPISRAQPTTERDVPSSSVPWEEEELDGGQCAQGIDNLRHRTLELGLSTRGAYSAPGDAIHDRVTRRSDSPYPLDVNSRESFRVSYKETETP